MTSRSKRKIRSGYRKRLPRSGLVQYPFPDAKLENRIVRSQVPEVTDSLRAQMVRFIQELRLLDLKKPPSIAESIDWARALLLLGADDVDRAVLEKTMSIIVKHRTDLDVVTERLGVKPGLPQHSLGAPYAH